MRTVDILEAKSSFSLLVKDIEEGRDDEIVISRDGRLVAKLVPIGTAATIRFGALNGRLNIPDDFDAQNAEVEKLFCNGNLD